MEGSGGGEVPGLKRAVTSDGAITLGDNAIERAADMTFGLRTILGDVISGVRCFSSS